MKLPQKLRPYTLAEIDDMREALFNMAVSDRRFYPLKENWKPRSSGEDSVRRDRKIEAHLRTYMLGSVDPVEVCAKGNAAKEEHIRNLREYYAAHNLEWK